MAKYDPLRQHLSELPDIEWTPSFSEIELILGSSLPASATQHRTWWANSGGLLVHQEAWLTAGWRVESVEISRRQVTFRRKGVSAGNGVSRTQPVAERRERKNGDGALPAALIKTLAASRKPVNLSARIDWTDVGVGKRRSAGWRLPSASNVPALCRFHVFSGDDHRILVVAVRNLEGFLRQLEIGDFSDAIGDVEGGRLQLVSDAMANADFVGIDAATPGQAWILVDGRGRKADLMDEDDSWLVARAAAVVDRQAGHEAILIRN